MPPGPRRHRRVAALLAAALVAGGATFAAVRADPGPAAAARVAAAVSTTAPTTAATRAPATARPEVRVTTAGEAPASGLPRPEPLPEDPHAPEPVRPLGTVRIPAIDLHHQVYEGVTLTTIDRGPGHWPGTAMPGQVGNAVFGGHRTTHTEPFRRLDELRSGDEVVFTDTDGHEFVYEHVSTEVVTPETVSIATQTTASTATLFACHPPGSARLRIVAHLRLVGGSGLPQSFPARDR